MMRNKQTKNVLLVAITFGLLCTVATAQIEHPATLQTGSGEISALVFSPDAKIIAVGCRADGGYQLQLWNVSSRTLHRGLAPSNTYSEVNSVAFSSNGKVVASGGDTICLWDVVTGRLIRKLAGRGIVTALAFSPEGRYLVCGRINGRVELWDALHGRLKAQLGKLVTMPYYFGFSSKGDSLVGISGTGAKGYEITEWDIEKGKIRRRLTGQPLNAFVHSFALSTDRKVLVAARDNEVRLWHFEGAKATQHTLKSHTSWVTCVALSTDGSTIASAGADKAIKLWDTQTCQVIQTEQEQRFISKLVFSPNGMLLATGGQNGGVNLRRLK